MKTKKIIKASMLTLAITCLSIGIAGSPVFMLINISSIYSGILTGLGLGIILGCQFIKIT